MNSAIAKRALLIAAALLGAAALAWLAAGGLSKPAAASEAAPVVQDQATLAEAQAEVSVLAQPAGANDALPAQIADTPLLADDPVDVDSARMVRGVGRSVWLASSADGRSVCELAAGAMACPPVSEIVARGLSPIVFSRMGEPIHVSGVASDEVEAVDVIEADGSTTTVPVVDNLFTLDVDALPRELRWTGPNGPESFPFPDLPS